MALFEDMFKGNVGTGVAVAGAMLLAPTVMPVVGRILRPVAKAVIKTGMVPYREAMEGVGLVQPFVPHAKERVRVNGLDLPLDEGWPTFHPFDPVDEVAG